MLIFSLDYVKQYTHLFGIHFILFDLSESINYLLLLHLRFMGAAV